MLPADLESAVRRAMEEDIGSGDLTASLIARETTGHATVLCREPAVLCGAPWFDKVFELIDDRVSVEWRAAEGDEIAAGGVVCELDGPARALVSGERTALNFLQTLSGTATVTRRFVNAISHTSTKLLDTRKTLPGMRLAQKYAVRCGHGHNHRVGLFDGILIKENHIVAAGSIANAVRSMREAHGDRMIEVEVENLEELGQAIDAGADVLLLDNFSLADMRRAVALAAGKVELEASGGVDLDSVRAVAETGVDYLSVGALTKHVHAIDFSMRFSAEIEGGSD